ncbi:MAG TPA: TonB-dependent receptor [Acidobacteriaceae bacterium]|jgi:catecholate siderophore receptor
MKQQFEQRKTRRGWELRGGLKQRVGQVLLAASVVSGANVALAQRPSGPAEPAALASFDDDGAPQAGNVPTRAFDIPAQALPDALEAYKKATGLKVKLKMPADQITGFRTAGVRGTYTDAAALRQLLAQTGLSFHVEGDAVEIAIRNTETVDVTASVESASLQQFQEPLLDTAQTVNVVPQYVMQEQAVTGLRDGLRNVPGISLAAGEGGSQGDTLTIRGFNARNDIFLDGIRDFGSYYRDAFDYQSIDVLEGPASVEFGRGSTGGVVNQESKQAEVNEFVRGNVQLGTNAMRRVTADIDQPLTDVAGGAAFRVNLVGEETNVSERDITQIRRFGIAPSLAFGLSTKTRYFLNYLHEGENDTPDYGLPYFGASVAPVARTTYYGFDADNFLRTSPDVLTGKVEHDFGTRLTVRNTLRWANYPRDVRITEPQVNTAGTAIYTNSGANAGKTGYVDATTQVGEQCAIASTAAASCYATNTPLSLVTVKRNQLTSKSTEDTLWDQMSATGRFSIGHIENDGILILEGGRERSRPTRNSYTVPYAPLVNPNPYDPFAPTVTVPGVPTHVESQSFGIGFLDTIKLAQWLQASGGVRFDYFNTNAHSPVNNAATPVTAATNANRLDKQPTYRAALVAKPRPQGSIYFDYGTSFNPAAESLSLSANNATSAPEYNETYELGAKWSYLKDRLNLNGSVFRTEKLNARETDPNNSNNTINAGNQLVRGVQLGVLGHMPQSFDVILGYAYLDGRVESSVVNASPFAAVNVAFYNAWQTALKTNPSATPDSRYNTAPYFISPAGFSLANVPKNSGNVWVTHKVGWRFVVGFGGNYVGARRASSTSLIAVYNSAAVLDPASVPLVAKQIPSYTALNLMLKRPISDRLELQVNVNNLTNKFFIDQPHPNHLVPGEGVNAQFGLNYKY